MAKNGLNSLADKKFLHDCWKELYQASKKRKRDGSGIDGVSLNYFKDHEMEFIRQVSSVLKTKSYSPQPLLPHFIPKPNGKDRVICVPTVQDRLIQRAMIKFLNDRGYGFRNSISYGFVKGRSVGRAAELAIEKRAVNQWVYKADITQFFDTVDRDILLEKISKKIRLRSLHPLIEKIVRTEILYRHQGVEKRINKLGIKKGVGLRQGMPASPYLANVMLSDFDRMIEKHKLPLIRYADDIIAFGASEGECRRIHDICSDLLNDEELFIHPVGDNQKTVIANPTETVEFLGLGLAKVDDGYQLIVTDKQLQSLKQKILQVADMDYCRKNKITISGLTRMLSDKIAGFLSAYDLCSNGEQLDHCLKAAKSLALKNLFVNEFGISYEELTKKQKYFLEIADDE